MNKKNEISNKESGSAILWILVAVSLFAALNYAFNSSSRTSTSLITDAEAEAYANQIIQYGNAVKAAVKRLQLRGCSDTEISFENNIVAGYENLNAPDDGSCDIFNTAGGGLQWNSNFESFYSGYIPMDDVSSTEPELSLQILNIPTDTCFHINKALSISTDMNADRTDAITSTTDKFVGVYDNTTVTDISGDEISEFSGEKKYCRDDGTDSHYIIALIAR